MSDFVIAIIILGFLYYLYRRYLVRSTPQLTAVNDEQEVRAMDLYREVYDKLQAGVDAILSTDRKALITTLEPVPIDETLTGATFKDLKSVNKVVVRLKARFRSEPAIYNLVLNDWTDYLLEVDSLIGDFELYCNFGDIEGCSTFDDNYEEHTLIISSLTDKFNDMLLQPAISREKINRTTS